MAVIDDDLAHNNCAKRLSLGFHGIAMKTGESS